MVLLPCSESPRWRLHCFNEIDRPDSTIVPLERPIVYTCSVSQGVENPIEEISLGAAQSISTSRSRKRFLSGTQLGGVAEGATFSIRVIRHHFRTIDEGLSCRARHPGAATAPTRPASSEDAFPPAPSAPPNTSPPSTSTPLATPRGRSHEATRSRSGPLPARSAARYGSTFFFVTACRCVIVSSIETGVTRIRLLNHTPRRSGVSSEATNSTTRRFPISERVVLTPSME